MKGWSLPGSGDRIILITPPTTFVATELFLYGHRLYTIPFHTARLRDWLGSRCAEVFHIDCPLDHGSRPRPLGMRIAGPRSRVPEEVACYAFGLDEDSLRRRLAEIDAPDQVWITTMFAYDRNLLGETIASVRAALPGTPVIVGGSYASLCPKDCLALGADHVHQGLLLEAENTGPTRIGPFGFVVAGRGCPNRCTYCAFRHVEGGRPVSYEPDRVVSQIAKLAGEGVSALALYSPAIFRGTLAAPSEAILEGIADLGMGVLGWAGFESRALTPHRARLMRNAGFVDPTVPLQTYDRELARRWGRTETLDDVERAIGMLLDAGYSRLEIGSDVIIGHPDQPLEETVRSMCYCWSRGITPVVFPYTWIPRSADAERLGMDLRKTSAESFQPYLFPFAMPDRAVRDYMELAKLSRILPPLVEEALGYLDPDGPVRPLVLRHLDAFGFAVPQWRLDWAPSLSRRGYSTFMSHPWELAMAALEGGATALEPWLVDACRRVRTCEPRYHPIVESIRRAESP